MGTDEKLKLLIEFMNQNHSLKEIVELMKAERASSLDYKSKFEEEHKLNVSLQFNDAPTKDKDGFDALPALSVWIPLVHLYPKIPRNHPREKSAKEFCYYRQGDVVSGTHASSSFLAFLAFNKYVLDTPMYREVVRMMDEQVRVIRMTPTNRLEKGCKYVNGLIKILLSDWVIIKL